MHFKSPSNPEIKLGSFFVGCFVGEKKILFFLMQDNHGTHQLKYLRPSGLKLKSIGAPVRTKATLFMRVAGKKHIAYIFLYGLKQCHVETGYNNPYPNSAPPPGHGL